VKAAATQQDGAGGKCKRGSAESTSEGSDGGRSGQGESDTDEGVNLESDEEGPSVEGAESGGEGESDGGRDDDARLCKIIISSRASRLCKIITVFRPSRRSPAYKVADSGNAPETAVLPKSLMSKEHICVFMRQVPAHASQWQDPDADGGLYALGLKTWYPKYAFRAGDTGEHRAGGLCCCSAGRPWDIRVACVDVSPAKSV
jgi:hypothetical protein